MYDQKKRVGYCREFARRVLASHGILRPPVPVDEIAEKEGFSVKYLKGESNNFSGLLHRDLKAIGINADHPEVRQRFSLAHELGHYYLEHPQEEESIGFSDEQQEWRICEAEANEFAGELLVPRDLLKGELKKLREQAGLEEKVQALIVIFSVSREVLVIQLTKHGLLMKI